MTDRARGMYPYWFVLPALLSATVATFIPTLYTFYLSFTNWSLYHFHDYHWVGLRNYADILFGSELGIFLRVFVWTIAWSAISVFGSLVVGMIYAMLLNRKDVSLREFYRTALIVPWAMPSFITVLMWGGLMDSEFGQLNQFVKGLGGTPVPWLTDPGWARFSVLLVNIWLTFPFMMSITLGALQSIPGDLYEAADIDGASRPTQFWKITLPMLRNALVPVIITSFAFAFNNFIGIYLLTRGGPPVPGGGEAGATDILVSYTFKLGFNLSQYGLASAYAVLIFGLIGGLSLINSSLTGAFKDA
ncbi:MAG: sugar ABC transporter permease [Armatimonadetes bacterium]|nr:sugar ABC transporter permease [Armatimonadota bacterium]